MKAIDLSPNGITLSANDRPSVLFIYHRIGDDTITNDLINEMSRHDDSSYIDNQSYILLGMDNPKCCITEYYCPIPDIIDNDVYLLPKYISDNMDRSIIVSEATMMDKIERILNVAIEHVYKTDTIDTMFIHDSHPSRGEYTSTPLVIARTINERFDVIDSWSKPIGVQSRIVYHHFTIKKRSNNQ